MIEINNLTRSAVDKKFFLAVAKKVLAGENRGTERLSIAFVAPQEMQKLNGKYRRKNKPTDVLALEKVSDFKDEMSEVILCPAQIREKNQDSPLSQKKLMAKTLVHGVLHVLGYDHERSAKEAGRMEEKEAYYFKKISRLK
jgi:rRNA maturation RNase YbeY